MRDPSPKLTAAYIAAQDSATRAQAYGDHAGAAFARADARRIFRRIRRSTGR